MLTPSAHTRMTLPLCLAELPAFLPFVRASSEDVLQLSG